MRLEQLADTPFLLYQRSFVLSDRELQACEHVSFIPKEGGRWPRRGVTAQRGCARVGAPKGRAIKAYRAGFFLRLGITFIWRDGAYLSRAAQAWLERLREHPVTESVI